MTHRALRSVALALTALACCVPAAFAQGDYTKSDNVEHVGYIKEVGDGVGGKIVGNTMFVTSTTHLTIYDVTNAEAPEMLGTFTMNIEFENEEVPTNGKILGIAADTFCVVPDQTGGTGTSGGQNCLTLYDVSDPSNVKFLKNLVGAGSHTHACVLDCQYFFGDNGKIVDARDPANAKLLETNWWDTMVDRYGIEVKNGCHHVREIVPGIILGSCNPIVLFSVLPEHGGSIENPALLAQGIEETSMLVHSGRWPRDGKDKFVLIGEEAVLEPQCTDAVSAFQVWDGSQVRKPGGGFLPNTFMTLVDEYRPVNGNFTDGNSPYNALGCSVHWFQEHPSFRNGGLVALAAYENGTKFLQVGADGKLTEQGFFLPAAGSTSSPLWHPNGEIVYNIDYTRGIDILKWTGETYQGPEDPPAPGGDGSGGDGAQSSKRKAPGLRFKVTPRRDSKEPFRFRTTGELLPPSGVTPAAGCKGRVSVIVKRGKKTVSSRRARVGRDCKFAKNVTFTNRKRFGKAKALRFIVIFQGNKALLPRKAKAQTARIR